MKTTCFERTQSTVHFYLHYFLYIYCSGKYIGIGQGVTFKAQFKKKKKKLFWLLSHTKHLKWKCLYYVNTQSSAPLKPNTKNASWRTLYNVIWLVLTKKKKKNPTRKLKWHISVLWNSIYLLLIWKRKLYQPLAFVKW